jgi:hypothetical protein
VSGRAARSSGANRAAIGSHLIHSQAVGAQSRRLLFLGRVYATVSRKPLAIFGSTFWQPKLMPKIVLCSLQHEINVYRLVRKYDRALGVALYHSSVKQRMHIPMYGLNVSLDPSSNLANR